MQLSRMSRFIVSKYLQVLVIRVIAQEEDLASKSIDSWSGVRTWKCGCGSRSDIFLVAIKHVDSTCLPLDQIHCIVLLNLLPRQVRQPDRSREAMWIIKG